MRVGWALTPDCELDSKTTDIKWQLHSSRSNVSEVLFDAATSHFSANLNAHIRQSIHDCIPKHILGDKMRKSVLNPIRNSAINLIEDLHSLWPDKTICSFNNRLEFLSVHYGTKPERCTVFCPRSGFNFAKCFFLQVPDSVGWLPRLPAQVHRRADGRRSHDRRGAFLTIYLINIWILMIYFSF